MEVARTKAMGVRNKKNLKAADDAREVGEEAFAALRFVDAAAEFEKAKGVYAAVAATEAKAKADAEKRKAEKAKKKEAERVKHEKELEAYRRKYYPEFYQKRPLSGLKPISYW